MKFSARCTALAALTFLIAPFSLAAQHLTPARAEEKCAGEHIVEVTFNGLQRDITDRFGSLGAFVNSSARRVQPQTSTKVIANFVQLHEGDVCDEQRRGDSERLLRLQPFISDAVIRVEHIAPDSVRLRVETIDEYIIFIAAWGLTGVPVGFEVGTGNLFVGARTLAGTLEYGRGGNVGGGVKYADYQMFGKPIVLRMNYASRPLAQYGGVSLVRPFVTGYRETSWQIGSALSRTYVTFRDPTFRDVSLDYSRRSWILGAKRRYDNANGGANFGVVAAGEYANPERTVAIRESGPVPASAPELLARYPAFESARVGVSAGYNWIHFLEVRGLDYLSAPQDVVMGLQVAGIGLKSLNFLARESPDWVGVGLIRGAAGNAKYMLQGTAEVETRAAANALPSVIGSGRIGWFGKTSPGHVTSLGLEFAGGVRTRLPLQITFRDDDGLIGFRTQDFGGAQRTMVRFEDRHAIPSPSQKLELALAGLAQAGRLVAGDAAYGITTPWRYGVGVALIGGIPAGSKHTVRLEFGLPVNPAGSRSLQFRIGYGERVAFFGGEPYAITSAREAAAVAR
ncbi:MAG: hypothetical protein ABI852_17795 [Gemmatimonadaceae bacterium]